MDDTWDDGHFGEDVAADYDGDAPDEVDPVVDVLAELAGGGRALEFAVGTGRIALPLAARGVPVHGIDISRAMLARLRSKPGADAVPATLGDIAETRVDGEFAVAYLVFNTIMNLCSQDAQVACFRNAAAHLAPGGCFAVEVMVPQLRKLPPGQNAVPFHTGPRHWGIDLYRPATQGMSSNHFDAETGRFTYYPFRYVWPAELDLMARLAGMRLRSRWSGWGGEPFTDESEQHVSVWEKPA